MTVAPPPPPSSAPSSPAEPAVRPLEVAIAWFVGFLASNTAVVAYLVATGRVGDPDPLDGVSIVVSVGFQAFLWVGLVGGPIWLSRRRGTGSLRVDYRLQIRPTDAFHLLTGVATQVVAVPVLYLPIFWLFGDHDLSADARELTDRAVGPVGVVILVVLVGIGAPFAEELFFRGALISSLRHVGRSDAGAVVASSVAFGLVHLQVLQLPALVLIGAVCGVLRVRSGRLGPALAAHAGFNAVALVTLLA